MCGEIVNKTRWKPTTSRHPAHRRNVFESLIKYNLKTDGGRASSRKINKRAKICVKNQMIPTIKGPFNFSLFSLVSFFFNSRVWTSFVGCVGSLESNTHRLLCPVWYGVSCSPKKNETIPVFFYFYIRLNKKLKHSKRAAACVNII